MALIFLPDTLLIKRSPNHSTEELTRAGRYADVSQYITSEHFPVRCVAPDRRVLKFAECNRDAYHAEVLEDGARLGLARPEYEDVLFLGKSKKFSEKFAGKLVSFLHEPWSGLRVGAHVSHIVMCVWHTKGNGGVFQKRLALDWERRKWPVGTIFGFVETKRLII